MNSRSVCAFLVVAFMAACQQPTTEPSPPVQQPATEIVAAAPELLPNLREPADGIISGGQPSTEQLTAARDAGYKTVINLRLADERGVGDEPDFVAGLGMEYVSLPIAGSAGLTKENVLAFAEALETAEYPLVLHCGSGNRIGAMFALKAFWVDGTSAQEALQIGRNSGLTRLEGAVAEILESESSG